MAKKISRALSDFLRIYSNKPAFTLLFSIITVTYNAEMYVERTIRSVIEQEEAHEVEYILVDGKSTDGTMEIVHRYRDQISRIISEPDRGLYHAMNKGLELATGEYVWFMNAGDSIEGRHTVKKLKDLIQAQPIVPDVIYGDTLIVDQKDHPLGPRRLKPPKSLSWGDFKWGMLVCHQSFIPRKEIAPLFNETYRFLADYDWALQCLKASASTIHSGVVLSRYMEEGVSTKNRKAALKERYYIMKQTYGALTTNVLHLWFAIRFYSTKLLTGRV